MRTFVLRPPARGLTHSLTPFRIALWHVTQASVVAVLLVIAGCQSSGRTDAHTAAYKPQPFFEGLGDYHRPIQTADARAQRYFDQGLTLSYAFNHDEAIRSFQAATRLDPECAMAWWGVALCNGPHINNPIVPPERSKAAWDALQQARAHRHRETSENRALIEALAARYSDPAPADRRALDEAYAAAMKQVYERFPADPDVGALYAEACMDLRPWDLWTADGQPQPGTLEILEVLTGVQARAPHNPGAPHLYIHAIEASPHPERGLEAADRLCDLTPGAGHLVHMPSHIYVLTGRWPQACRQNEKAIAADRAYRAISPNQGFFRLYMIHNHHMLAFASMMEGRREAALEAARSVVGDVPVDYARSHAALVDPYMAIVTEVLMRFGRWNEILQEPAPPTYWPITTTLWHFARGVALANLDEIDKAEAERLAFEQAAKRVPADALMAINKAHDVLAIARHMLAGEIAYNRGDVEVALAELRRASELESKLRYMEPPEWIQPARHALGAILLDSGHVAEAERVYRADLAKWPENGWALYGLARCLERKGATDEAEVVNGRFAKAWERSDTPIHASCLCVKPRGS